MSMDRSFQWMDLIGTGAIGTVQLMIMLYDMMVKKKKCNTVVPPKYKFFYHAAKRKRRKQRQSADVGI